MNAYETIITRRSTRKFRNREVDEKLTDLIIEAGRHAPSGGNSQSSHFFVITNRELLEKLALMVSEAFRKMEVHEGMYRSLVTSITRSKQGNYIFHYGCPMLIVVANKKDYGNNIADCACALENMMIAANSLDLGTC